MFSFFSVDYIYIQSLETLLSKATYNKYICQKIEKQQYIYLWVQ